jgi:amino acid adenylation domain-containing protein
VARLLGSTAAGLDADATFLELGADSLLLMQLVRAVEGTYGVRIPFRRLMEELATIRDLAAHLEQVRPATAVGAAAPAAPDSPPAEAHLAPAPAENGNGVSRDGLAADRLALLQAHAATMQAYAATMQAYVASMNAQLEALDIPPTGRNGGPPAAAGRNGSNGQNGAGGEAPLPPGDVEDGPVARAAAGRAAGGHAGPVRRVRASRGRLRPAAGAVASSEAVILSGIPIAGVAADRAGESDARAVVRSFPLTPTQRQMWVHARLGDDASRAYNLQVVLGLRGAFDASAFDAALQDLAARHESLRTVFAASGDAQHVLASLRVPLTVAALPDGDDGDALRGALAAAVHGVFDLAAGPPIRAYVHVRGPERHVAQLVFHHLVADAIAAGVLKRDLEAAYRARRDGQAPRLDPPMQFGDYAARRAARAGTLDGREAEWMSRFEGAVPFVLPHDRPRSAIPDTRGARERRILPPPLVAALGALAREERCTPFGVLLAGVLVVLHRLAARDDLVLGVPSAGRALPGSETVVGSCVSVLPLRSRPDERWSVREHLRQVRGWLLDAAEHEEFSYARLREAMRQPLGPASPPLVSVTFNLDPGGGAADPGGAFAGLALEPVEKPALHTSFDLAFDVVERGGDVEIFCDYATALFDGDTVARTLARLERVLEQFAAASDGPVSALTLLDEAERRQVVEAWNRTEAPAPEACASRLFERQAERTPAAPAVLHGDERMSYRELNERANRLARSLVRTGVGAESRVGVHLERGPELVVALLAVLKAGGAYVPLDPAYPLERLGWMLADSGAAVLLTRGRPAEVPLSEGVRVVSLEAEAAAIDGGDAENLAADPVEGALAYVIHTSGSTGTPKGVGIDQRALAGYVAHAAREYALTPGDRVLQFHSVSFDPAAEEIFATLLSGATLVLRGAGAIDPPVFWAACRRDALTVLVLPTAVWHSLVPHLEAHPSDFPPSLRLLVTGGERMLPEPLRAWRRVVGDGVRLLNSYGPTETTVGATLWDAAGAGDDPHPAVPIGRPVPNTRCYVLDAGMRPVPVGVPGELWIGGAQVARGYLGRAALTAERFVPEPFGGHAGGRMYRTGDRARWRADGVLEYLGRVDDQVKVRGFRVEPAEIEAALLRHPGVAACAVVARESASGDRRLVAYVVGASDAAALRAHLRRMLPEHMVPGAFVGLDALPLTPAGKVDRRALPAPAAPEGEGRSLKPATEAEARVAAVWRELLGIERVGMEDSFFDLGGHSLLLVRLQARLASDFRSDLSVLELFQYPTVRSLAARLQGGDDVRAVEAGEGQAAVRQDALRRLATRGRRDA